MEDAGARRQGKQERHATEDSVRSTPLTPVRASCSGQIFVDLLHNEPHLLTFSPTPYASGSYTLYEHA